MSIPVPHQTKRDTTGEEVIGTPEESQTRRKAYTENRVSYSSMLINVNNPVEVTSFLPTLSSTLQSAGLDTQVKIACCDTIGWANAKTVTSRLLSAGMEKYLGLLTSHMYTGDPNSAITGTKLPAWMTEGADLNSRWCTTWYSNGGLCEGLTWANKVATGILSANLSGYIYWQGLEVNQGQASSYLVYVIRLVCCDFF